MLINYHSPVNIKTILYLLACGSNCKACTVQNGSPKCTTCATFPGENTKGYFKKADSSCSACPSNCNTCTNDANDKAKVQTCYTGYVKSEDGLSCLSKQVIYTAINVLISLIMQAGCLCLSFFFR